MSKPSKQSNEMYKWFLDVFNCKELRYLPDDVLKEVLANNTAIYEEYIKKYPDLTRDSLKEFFETYFADRKFLSQDFTPDDVAMLMAEICGAAQLLEKDPEILDECAGIGTLIIPTWRANPDVMVYARELSAATVPFLLFNLALRNMQGVVVRGDTLSLETFAVYILNKGEKFSTVTEFNLQEEIKRIDPLMFMKLLISRNPERFKYEKPEKKDSKQIGFFDKQEVKYS